MSWIGIPQCTFCGDDATQKAADNTHCCENCIMFYAPKQTSNREKQQ